MINTKTYLSKCNTIISDSVANTGKNAVLELMYGKDISRALIYFDHTKVKRLVEDKTYPDINKLKHVLHLTNSGGIAPKFMNCMELRAYDPNGTKLRAQSFDLIFFLIPNDWDNGRGAAHFDDMYARGCVGYSDGGSNWYKFRDGFRWENEGIYTTKQLMGQMDLFTSKNGNLSDIIIGYQHFDYGSEDIELDITCIFNKFITGELENYGLGICFSPAYESTKTKTQQSVCFFSNSTHTFFEPYVETTYGETLQDDRANFYLDKENRLYFYATVGGKYVNLDELPECTVDGKPLIVHQATKGIYYAEINLKSDEYEPDTMIYDIWSNIIHNGRRIPDVELSFTSKAAASYFSFGLPTDNDNDNVKTVPSLYGINHAENVKQGETRKVIVSCKIPYTSDQQRCVDGLEYRVYIKSGEHQIDVIRWSDVERGYNQNYFLLNTADLLPWRYHIDIRATYNQEVIIHNDLLTFDVVSDKTQSMK